MSNEITPIDYLNTTLSLRNQIEAGFLELGKRLHTIKSGELWKANYSTYQEFLAEMRFSEATDSKLRTIYQRFILEYKLPVEKLSQIGWSSLYMLATKVDDKQTALDIIEYGRDLKRDDFADAVRSATVGAHRCLDTKKVVLIICGICGKARKVPIPEPTA